MSKARPGFRLPKTLTIRSEEIREALQEPLTSILESVRLTLERCPPELAATLWIAAWSWRGGSLLRGIDRLVAEETGLPVHLADDPMSAVAEGTGRVLQEIEFLKRVRPTPNIDFPPWRSRAFEHGRMFTCTRLKKPQWQDVKKENYYALGAVTLLHC